jgi:hypothetical protein
VENTEIAWIILGGASFLTWFGAWGMYHGLRWKRRWQLRERTRRATDGELRAQQMLMAQGYQVEGCQVSTKYEIGVGPETVVIGVRADYLVSKDERWFIAEVKTGKVAPHIQCSATRRQMLEYWLAFDVDGMLLVDAEQEQIAEVLFPSREPNSKPSKLFPPWVWWLVGVAMGAVVVRWLPGALRWW